MNGTREAILDCLGTLPNRPDPAVEPVSITAADGFERRLLEYDVEPGERIRASLLVPDGGSGERPGVLAVHPHAGEFAIDKSDPAGLSDTTDDNYGVELCRRVTSSAVRTSVLRGPTPVRARACVWHGSVRFRLREIRRDGFSAP